MQMALGVSNSHACWRPEGIVHDRALTRQLSSLLVVNAPGLELGSFTRGGMPYSGQTSVFVATRSYKSNPLVSVSHNFSDFAVDISVNARSPLSYIYGAGSTDRSGGLGSRLALPLLQRVASIIYTRAHIQIIRHTELMFLPNRGFGPT